MNDITRLTLTETVKALREKQFSEEELNSAYLKRIKALDSKINSYLYVNEDVKGIPAAIKMTIVTEGIVSSTSSKVLSNFIPPYNATVIEHLINNGVGVIGKTNCDEFAMGSSGENSAFVITKNPWDFSKIPGGSSSGSAAAVAADLCVFSLGSDTGGSVRQPAAMCGMVGLKPSYGRVSRYGLIAMGSSLNQIGPITKSVTDARLVLDWISGPDGRDSNMIASPLRGLAMTSLRGDPQSGVTRQSLKSLKVGIPKEYFGKGLDSEVERVTREAINKLEELGAKLVEITLPHTEYAIAAYYIIMPSEVSSDLARMDGIRFGFGRDQFGSEPKRRIMLGTFALSAGYFEGYYIKAAQVRTLIKQDFEKAFQKCEVIVGPVSPTTAWNIGEKNEDPLAMYLSDVYTVPASMAGLPGLSVPCGFVPSAHSTGSGQAGSGQVGLPVGLQILGPYKGDEIVLNVGEIFQNNTDFHKQKPKL